MEQASAQCDVYLRPGDFRFGDGMLRINTLLGSCVAIVLWHPERVHGGMCHYMLPSRNLPRGNLEPNGKYADEAMELFMMELDKRHAAPAQYRVNVYGGGNMFSERPGQRDIGTQNIEMAHRLLEVHGFTLAHDHLGGFGRRKVGFDVWSGEVRLVHVDHRTSGS